MENNKNLVLAVIFSVVIMVAWQYFYEAPKQKSYREKQHYLTQVKEQENKKRSSLLFQDTTKEQNATEKLILVKNKRISGKISTKGLKFKELELLDYAKSLENKEAFSLLNSDYFVAFGFIGDSSKDTFPTIDTIWEADSEIISNEKPVTFTWDNGKGLIFAIRISLDENYMFYIEHSIENSSKSFVDFKAYGLLNRGLKALPSMSVAHEGVVSVFDGKLKEIKYSDLESKKDTSQNIGKGWLGFTDKYWVTAMIPGHIGGFSANFFGYKKDNINKFQVDFLDNKISVAPGNKGTTSTLFYAGPKEISLLDSYEISENITFFDRAVDFGWFYFLTKPMYLLLKFLNGFLHNWGFSIMALTLVVKLLMFPIANKSFRTMNKMKKLQPEVDRIRTTYASDKIRLQQEMMTLYKKHKVSTLSGCLPILLQIPVFFSLYKVIYISIDLRQAPFIGWIKDLSSPDPTSITNLFGLLPYEPFQFLQIGVLPILMAGTMYVQQLLSPPVADQVQAKIMKFLPLIFLFMFYSFPSGLLLYWTFSNILSIAQQYTLAKLSKK